MIRQLAVEELENLYPFIEALDAGFTENVTMYSTVDQRFASVLRSHERMQAVGLEGTGVWGLFEGETLKMIVSVLPWREQRYYTLRNIFGRSTQWKDVSAVIETAVQFMENEGYHTFYWARPMPVSKRVGKELRTRLFLTKVVERYDVIVECFGEYGVSPVMETFLQSWPNTVVFRASLKNQFRPYQAGGSSR